MNHTVNFHTVNFDEYIVYFTKLGNMEFLFLRANQQLLFEKILKWAKIGTIFIDKDNDYDFKTKTPKSSMAT